ncbi:hypothetical protein ABW19_dt0202996 [Dactylella cylindrospora]|nr:hypothetical protein ABW19_dt0202996 [Dactylella cylindrospora]
MFGADPVMHLDPKGFRGIVRTRLATPRTAGERDIIAHQGSNWPPWKEVTDGYDQTYLRIDSDSEEPIIGSGGLFLKEMQRAGYPLGVWEKSAMILSGLEEGGTPTVPRRTWFVAGTSSGRDNPHTIWQARIRATRTLNEAWHMFLRFLAVPLATAGDHAGVIHVFKDMFQKILQARKQDWQSPEPVMEEPLRPPQQPKVGFRRFIPEDEWVYVPPEPPPDETASFLRMGNTTVRGPTTIKYGPNNADPARMSIGDTKDILPPPLNPARGAYVSTPPPTVEELWALMLRRNIKPDLGLIKLLVSNSTGPAEAQVYLEEWYSRPRKRLFQGERKDVPWAWWSTTDPKELERIGIANHMILSTSLEKPITESNARSLVSASDNTAGLVMAYIEALSSTTFPPRNGTLNVEFTNKLLFQRVPNAIALAQAFKLKGFNVWESILKALNYPRLPRGLFQSAWAKTSSQRYAALGFLEGPAPRKMKLRDLNVCAYKISEYLHDHWGYIRDPATMYQFAIAAERGWDYEQQLIQDRRAAGHQAMPFRAADVVDVFETMVWIRDPRKRAPKHPSFVSDHPPPESLPTAHDLRDHLKKHGLTEEDENWLEENMESNEPVNELVNISAGNESKSFLPPIVTPRTAHIHAYIRLLLKTAEEDYEPIVRLLRWMVRHSDFLDSNNRRLPIIAMRAMWYSDDHVEGLSRESLERRQRNYVEARRLVSEDLREWGGWATDVEEAAYNGENWRELRDEAAMRQDQASERKWNEEMEYDDDEL